MILHKIVEISNNRDGTHHVKAERPAVGAETPVVEEFDVVNAVAVKLSVNMEIYPHCQKPAEEVIRDTANL